MAASSEPAADVGPLPSIGSASHAVGECRRCNFFPKGRCQNGYDCTFCHFPHEKQKLSRQEKRERREVAQRARGENDSSTCSTSEGTPVACLATACVGALGHGKAAPGLCLDPALAAGLDEAAFPILSTLPVGDPITVPVASMPDLRESGNLRVSLPPGLLPPPHLAVGPSGAPVGVPGQMPPRAREEPLLFSRAPPTQQLSQRPPAEEVAFPARVELDIPSHPAPVSIGTQTDTSPVKTTMQEAACAVPQSEQFLARSWPREVLLQARGSVQGGPAGIGDLRALRINW